MNATERIKEIDLRLEQLVEERKNLEVMLQQRKDDKWSEEGMKEQLRKAILSRFGSLHKIKMAKLILNSSYNDEYYNYSPILLLLDEHLNEIGHDINEHKFCPDEDEQREYYESTGNEPNMGSINIRYS